MKHGIGLPATIPDVSGDVILEWARRADAAGFSSLGIIDRLLYANYEPLVTLAAAAGATTRIRLMTMILIAPLRNPIMLAKQAATLDTISGGRLTLGLGLGAREDDYNAAGVPFDHRGRRLEEQLRTMRRIWNGEPLSDGLGAVGPKPARPGGPEVLLGAYSPAAIQRSGVFADGFILGGATDPSMRKQIMQLVETSWQAAGRPGRPRFVASLAYALGAGALERGAAYVRDYYAYLGPRAELVAKGILDTPEKIKGAIGMFQELGVDELILFAAAPDIEQFDRIAELIG
jgi:alkanesulfonate monooxygenase SsuD/methylene tetrahydromethanopterin reductase-like flavin-dependent oxidoreductase (luciferase family)